MALCACGVSADFKAGAAEAAGAIDSGAATATLERWIAASGGGA